MPASIATDPPRIKNRIFVLVLQHPQEKDVELGTAALTVGSLERAKLTVGLSWPNLIKALGRNVDPKRWAVLYLGSAKLTGPELLTAVARTGSALPDQKAALADIHGLVLLDGSWSQAKALWWRNPWLLRLQRLVLNPSRPSRYGRLRREPRGESVSTLEAVAATLALLERDPAIETALLQSFETMLRDYREARRATKPAPDPA
jgi:DTW domain-containing protein YfiP